MNRSVKLGAHLSIVGGISKAVEAAIEIRANTLQIFSGPPRNWKKPKPGNREVRKFRSLAKQYQISPIFIHAKYLVNLASKSKVVQEKSIQSLVDDLDLSHQIGAVGVIFHPHPKNLRILVKNIKRVLKATPPSTQLILENSAQTKLEIIGEIIKKVKSRRVKFCFDLAHAYQAGYDLANPKGLEKVFELIQKKVGYHRWVAIHANDSKTALGSKHDRHQDIAKGKLGPMPFFVFLNHLISSKLPFILETPGFKEKGPKGDRENLAMLKKLIGKKLDKNFFNQPTDKAAKELLGKYLVINRSKRFQIGKIIETEAYVGPQDRASHAFFGKTKRNQIMWGPPGQLYVYLIYGIYCCLNIVTEKEGYPAAVLIRALEPVFGISDKTDGPGKVCQELKITTEDTGLDITESNEIFIKDVGERPKRLLATPRIGVNYAADWAKKKLRFCVFDKKN